MTSPMLDQPCEPWPITPFCLPSGWDVEALTPEQDWAVSVATTILWRLTAGRYGLCELTIRPCRQRCSGGSGFYFGTDVLRPLIVGGSWINFGCGCTTSCGCGPICEIALPGPAHDVVGVKIDGVEREVTDYRIDNAKWLVRTNADVPCWPDCQDLSLPDSEPGTFSITYSKGVPLDDAGILAVTKYAVEIWKACTGTAGCVLPQRVQSINREGVSMALFDPMEFLDKGRTGIPMVDTWIASVNPNGFRDRSRVYSPDRYAPRRQTFP